MAKIKCTMLIDYTSNVSNATAGARTGGFSESVYHIDSGKVQTDFLNLMIQRAKLLPQGSRIVGQRYQTVDPVGGAQTGGVVLPGTAGLKPDVPQMALLARIGGQGVNNFRPYYFRAIPDVRSVEGEYNPSINFTAALSSFSVALEAFQFKAVNLNAAQAPVLTISALGVVKTSEDFAAGIGDTVQVLRTENTSGNLIGGKFQVEAVVGLREFTLADWDDGLCAGGRVRFYTVIYPNFDKDKFGDPRIVVKKVGAPFNGYAGKASRKR